MLNGLLQVRKILFFKRDHWLPPTSLTSLLALNLLVFCLGTGGVLGNEGHPLPFDPKDMRHGFSKFDSIPVLPPDSSSDSAPYQETLVPDSPGPADESPKGLFLNVTLAEGFEEDLEFRRAHLYYAIRPTESFQTDALAVFVVFRVHKHYAPYQIIGRLYPDRVDGLPADQWFEEDTVYLALEDESGYLKLFPPSAGWKPGQYRVEIYVGYEANPVTHMGTMRFTMARGL